MSSIYKITNKTNNKSYIGKTTAKKCIKYIKAHFDKAKNVDNDRVFYRAIRKYGQENFKWNILWTGFCDKNYLNELEKYYIYFYEGYTNGYNMTLGGDGGFVWPKEKFDKLKKLGKRISQLRDDTYLKGKNNWMCKLSEDELKKQNKKMLKNRDNTYLKGKNNPFCKLSPEKRMEIILKGNEKRRLYRHSEEIKRLMSETRIKEGIFKGRKNPMARKYKIFSDKNIEYFIQDGLKSFCNNMNISYEMIRKSIKNNGKKIFFTTHSRKTVRGKNTIGWRAVEWSI